jgi:membrane protein
MAALYYYVPNTRVRWGHAWTGGVFVAAGLELAKKLLAVYLAKVPTYAMVYGAFATLPILLIWIYVAWVIVLLGAVIAASLPGLHSAIKQRPRAPGQSFQLALETLQALDQARSGVARGLTPAQLAGQLRVTVARLEPVLATLRGLDWAAQLEELQDGTEPRLVLLVDPDATPLAPLLQALLLRREPSTENLWQIGRLPALLLRDAL